MTNQIDQMMEDAWSLDWALAKYILPRLLVYKNFSIHWGIPAGLDEEEWDEILTEMVWAFMYASDNYPTRTSEGIELDLYALGSNPIIIPWKEGFDAEAARRQDEINYARFESGMRLFAEYFACLWI